MTALPRGDALVLFGATGDLARRKIFPALYHLAKSGRLEMPVIGVARGTDDQAKLRERVAESISEWVDQPDAAVVDRLCGRVQLVCGDYQDHSTFTRLAELLHADGATAAVHYLAIPPSMFPVVIESLATAGLCNDGRVVVEKPFGRDLRSAQELNRIVAARFPEDRVFRIDHYLGKEAVEDLLVFRFANTFLEPIWNRNYVAAVQVTLAETIGVEGRGAFYDSVGALRDVVQNHLMQIVALLAMEPPVGPEARHLSDEKVKVFAAMSPIDPTATVRGQYDGYCDEPGVAVGSTTETYVACRLDIESWRWAGVPFYVRAGKALAAAATEVVVVLREPPAMLFDESGPPGPVPNLVRFRLGVHDGVTLTVNAKQPGPHLDSQPVDISVDFADALGTRQGPYERLIGDAIDGNQRRFGRQDLVEETWRIVQPVLDAPPAVLPYTRGSWGPAAADDLLDGHGWMSPER